MKAQHQHNIDNAKSNYDNKEEASCTKDGMSYMCVACGYDMDMHEAGHLLEHTRAGFD